MAKNIRNLKVKELEVVLKISQAVSRTLNLKEIIKMACRMTAQALNADRCSIGLLGAKGTYTITHYSYRRFPYYPSLAGEKLIAKHYPVIAGKLLEKKVVQIVRDQPPSFLSIKEKRLLRQLNMSVFLAVPILADEKPLGAFHLARVEKSQPFSNSDISLCQTIANQIGVAIKNATLVKELKEDHQLLEKQSEDLKVRYQQQNLVLDISKSLFRTSNLQEVFNIITQKTCEALRLDRCTILQFDSDQEEAVIRSVYHSSTGSSRLGTHVTSDLGRKFLVETCPKIYRLLRNKGFLLTEDFQSNPLLPRTRRYIKDLGVKSTLAIPFYSGKKISGSLQLSTLKDYHHFTDSEIKLCQTIANLASLALENVRLMDRLQEKSITLQQQAEILGKQYREQNILLEISKAVSQTLDLQNLFDIATETTVKLLNVERSTILFYDKAKNVATYKSAYIKGRHQREYVDRELKVSRYPTLANLLKRNLILSESDVSGSPFHPQDKKYFQKRGVKSILAASFSLGTGMAGIFSIGSHDRHIKFSDSEVRLCKSIANLLSVAIQNALLMQNLREKSLTIEQQTETLKKHFREQSILLEISKALSQTLDIEKLFEIVTKRTTELLGVDRCAIMLMDEVKDISIIYKVYAAGKHRPVYEGIQKSKKDFPILVRHLLRKPHLFCVPDVSQSDLTTREKKAFESVGMKSVLVIPFYLAGKNLGLLALSTLHRQHKFTESEISLGQAIANQLTMTVENARLVQDLQEKSRKIQTQTEALEKQFREQTILLEISKALSQTLDLKELFKIVTQKTVELLGIDRAVAMIIDQKTGNHSIFVHYSRVKNIPELVDFPKNISEFPYLIKKSRIGHIYSVFDTQKSGVSLREKNYFRKRKIKSVLVVPFILQGKLLGILSLNNITEKHVFTESEIKLTQGIANQLLVAVENANLMEISKKHSAELEKLSLQIINAQEEERKNLAGRLHDVVGQDLTALQLDLKMSKHEIPEQFAQTRARLEEEERLARQTLENVRNLTMDLRPPILDDFGLASAIRWYADGFSRRTNIKLSLKLQKHDCKLLPEFETAIYRAIQECLTNVVKHSEASRVSVSLDMKNEHLHIVVQDNGIGYEPANFHFTSGFGLFRLKEKTELLGGKFKIDSKRGEGTRVVIIFPCKK
ncbi:MAG TPA: GAF domain-containing sensor histidine kinase [Terriglobales bacterium]|nr:GAF domain-containing sensor histidine kinase [Terriglobales bacterium]